MASLRRDVETIVRRLVAEHGCEAKLTRGGHWRVSRPGRQSITIARTPSDQRAIRNVRQDVRRYLGVDLSAG